MYIKHPLSSSLPSGKLCLPRILYLAFWAVLTSQSASGIQMRIAFVDVDVLVIVVVVVVVVVMARAVAVSAIDNQRYNHTHWQRERGIFGDRCRGREIANGSLCRTQYGARLFCVFVFLRFSFVFSVFSSFTCVFCCIWICVFYAFYWTALHVSSRLVFS